MRDFSKLFFTVIIVLTVLSFILIAFGLLNVIFLRNFLAVAGGASGLFFATSYVFVSIHCEPFVEYVSYA